MADKKSTNYCNILKLCYYSKDTCPKSKLIAKSSTAKST